MTRLRSFFPIFVVLLACVYTVPVFAEGADLLWLPWSHWQIHASDDPRCASPDPVICAWKPASPSVDWQNDERVLFWLRVDVELPSNLRNAPELAVLIQGVQPVYEVYAGGRLIGASGNIASHNGPADARRTFVIPREAFENGRLALAVRMLNLHITNRVTDLQPYLGLMEAVQRERDLDTFSFLQAHWQHYLSFLLVFAVSTFFLLLFSMNHAAREYFWFAVLLFSIPMLRLCELSTVVDLGFSAYTALIGYTVFNVLAGVSFVEFPFAFQHHRVPWYFRLVQLGSVSIAAGFLYLLPISETALVPLAWTQQRIMWNLQHISLFAAMIAWIIVLPKCFRSPLAEMRWIGGSMTFLLFEEGNRHLTLANLPGIPQNINISPVDFDVRACAYLLFALVMLVAMTVRFRRIQDRNRKVEQELAAAAAVQSLLLSSKSASVGSFTVEAAYLPAGEVGGDFFHIVSNPSGQLLVVVGDVSGKGLKAAMTVATIIGALRDFTEASPRAVLAHLNRVLYGQVSGFVTCCAATIGHDGTMIMANAGHPAPYRNGAEISSPPGLPIGVLCENEWSESIEQLEPGDHLTFISDGVVESAKPITGELFGFDRVQQISTQSPESIAAAAKAFSAGCAQADDITVLGVGMRAFAS
jgi:hypothetical protein